MKDWIIKLAAKDIQEAASRQKRLLTTKTQKCFDTRHEFRPDAHLDMPLSQMLKSYAQDSPVESALKQMTNLDDAEHKLIRMRADEIAWKVILAEKEFQCDRT